MAEPKSTDPIVVVEDSAPNRKILCHLFEKLGYKVLPFEDGQQALDFLTSEPRVISAVVSDLMMPNLDGVGLLRKLREGNYKTTPFVLITAVHDKESVDIANELGVLGYMLKPVTFGTVTEMLKKIFPQSTTIKIVS